jgi:MFS family permease
LGTLLSRSLAGRYMDRFGPRPVAVIAFVRTLAATVPFGFVTASSSNIALMAVLFGRGIGLGAAMITLMGGAFVGLRREQIPAASSISRVAQQVGGCVGTAVLIMILQRTAAGAHTPAALAAGFADAFWWAAAFTAAAIPLCLLLPGRPSPEPEDQAAVLDEESARPRPATPASSTI